jgi:glycerol-3-phosphate acyltransferase PlsY
MDYLSTVYIVCAYLIGCINTGYYLVKFSSGEDIRKIHSGTAGATNAGRVLGKKGFFISFAGDFIKSILVMALATYLGIPAPVKTLMLLAVVAGHIFPVQIQFKGGKGISTICGGMLIYDPVITAISVAIFFACKFVLKNKLHSILFAIYCFGTLCFLQNKNIIEFFVFISLSFLITFKHSKEIITNKKKNAHGR